ncbi:MAG: acyl-CoA synthetase [Kiloniellales bacterium]|nr:acyl-CoA synthetase [Kiloniellales bacterium]
MYDKNLGRNEANYVPLTPISFLKRSAAVYPGKTAVIDGSRTFSYEEFQQRCARLASVLRKKGLRSGDCVAVMGANTCETLEAHFGVPMMGCVLNALNTRLDPATIAFILDHGEAKALITDRAYSSTIEKALKLATSRDLLVVDIDHPDAEDGKLLGECDYESLLAEGDQNFQEEMPQDEWEAISLLYTSGTTGNPKGVVYSHRGAYLNAFGNLITFNLAPESVYLWTLPMFHCNGWTYTWAVTAAGGTHLCLRKVDPALIFPMIRKFGVTHLCGAPVVLNMLANAPSEQKVGFDQEVHCATGGAPPPSAVIEALEKDGFKITHLYGLTESYGPASYCAWQDDWSGLSRQAKAEVMARQGVAYLTLEEATLRNPADPSIEVASDGRSIGEIMLRGNSIMKGYLKNPDATAAAFEGGFFHSGDLAVRHPDGYLEIKDRAKDIIISGGENISSVEIEEALYRHRGIQEAAVVAKPDAYWGETPCAFVTLKNDALEALTEDQIIAHCRKHLASYKLPKKIVFGPLPKTATGKIKKFELRERAKDL